MSLSDKCDPVGQFSDLTQIIGHLVDETDAQNVEVIQPI